MPDNGAANDAMAARDEQASRATALVPVGPQAVASYLHPQRPLGPSPAYVEFMEIRSTILDIVRRDSDQQEKLLGDIVDALCEVDPDWASDPMYWVKTLIKLGSTVRHRRKKRETIKKAVRSLLEKIFDPALEFKMTKKDILDTCEACGLKRDDVSGHMVRRMYVVIVEKLEVGELRDLVYEEPRLLGYASLKRRELRSSRLDWEVSR